MQPKWKEWRSLRANRRGSVMFEFALITPVFLTLLLTGLEYAFIMFSYSSIQQGTDFAARSISVNTAAAGQVQALVRSKVPDWVAPNVAVTVVQANVADPRQNTITVSSTTSAQNATPIAIFSKVFPWTLSTRVVVTQELPF
jgi:Flp pilus assembly protein TadG